MRRNFSEVEEVKGLPNVLLILSPEHFSLVKTFNKYANVFPYFIEPSSFIHVMHRVPGRMKADYKSFPSGMLTLLGKILNHPHKLKIKHVKPEDIDLVFVSDPVVCRIYLKKYKNAVKAYWSQDCIYQSTFYTQLLSTKVQDYDIIFCAHKPYLEHFKEFGVKTYWLPFAYDPDICRPMDLPEKYDVTFVGTLTENRKRSLMKIKEKFPYLKIFFGTAFQHNMAYIYNQSKVVLNISKIGELNWRVFEALGCRRALLTDKNNEVNEVFNDGEHLMTYSGLNELFDKLETLLSEEDMRLRIASTGYLEVSKRHTLYHRVKEILRVCGVG